MTKIYNQALKTTTTVNRTIGKILGTTKGPTLVFFGGIHGNETAGIFALQNVLKTLKPECVKGTIYAFSGNLDALALNQRYIDKDLNRLWSKQNIKTIREKVILNTEEKQLMDLLSILEIVIKTGSPPFYFIDLHTASSKTLPFVVINDALINRKFSKQFPVPVVLGIEEHLNGPLLSYINQLGYVSLGFESGQHDDGQAVTNCISFIKLALVFSRIISKEDVLGFDYYFTQLKDEANIGNSVFEVIYLYKIQSNNSFKMINGFKNFQAIKKGTNIALNNNLEIKSKYNAFIFMPLYQTIGNEGFFIIRPIKPFYLKLSAFIRPIKMEGFLVLLPGISWQNKEKKILRVNLKTACFFAPSFFHLLGYRNEYVTKKHLNLYNRERAAKTEMYKRETWYKR